MTFKVTGLEEVEYILENVAPNQAYNLMRATVQSIASGIAKDARNDAPEDEGDLKGAIKAKRERSARGYLLSTVRVNPVAFYWRFLEYGQGPDGEEHAMFMKAVEAFRKDFDAIFIREFGKKWEAALRRAAKKAAA